MPVVHNNNDSAILGELQFTLQIPTEISAVTTPTSEMYEEIDCYPVAENMIGAEEDEVEKEIEDEEKQKARREEEERAEKERIERKNKQRIHVMREILSTEQTYVDWLKVLDQEFMKPLKTSLEKGSDALLSATEYQNMFMDIEVVVRVNQELLKSLKEFFRHNGLLNDGQQPEDDTKNRSLGDIFLKMTPYLKSYTSYINKYESIFKFIEEKKETKKKFRKWLEKTEGQPATLHQQLLSFMILPVQRIPRYSLLLRELIGNMDETQVDYDKLVKANNDIKDVATRVNERLREQNSQERLVALSEQNVIEGLTFELLRASRKYLHEGVLAYVTSTGIKYRTVFLFSDLLLSTVPVKSDDNNNSTNNNSLSPPSENEPAAIVPQERYRMRSAVSFLSNPLVWINDLPDGVVLVNAFQVVSENKVWTFFTRTIEEKKEWISKLNKAMELLKHLPTMQNAVNAKLYAPPPSSKITSYLSPTSINNMQSHHDNPLRIPSPTVNNDSKNGKRLERNREGSFHKLLNKFQVKQKKKIELNQLVGTIESDDEEDEIEISSPITLKPWMEECNARLVEKQRYLQFISVLSKEKGEFAPFLNDLATDDFKLIINPLFGLKGPTPEQSIGNWRVSMETELKDKYREAEADFHSFISAFKGNIQVSSSTSPESTQQKRKSRFFFL